MSIPYGDLKELHQILFDAGVVKENLADWSTNEAARSGTDLYSEGISDNWIKSTSHGIDQALDAVGLTKIGENIGETVGGWVGNPEYGKELGHGLPRMAVDVLPMIAGTALAPFTGGASSVIGTAATAGLMGAGTYEKTGSPVAGLLSAGLGAVMPAVGKIGGELGLRAVGTPLIEGAMYETGAEPLAANLAAQAGVKPAVQVAERIPTNLWQGAAGQVGANAAMYGAMQAGAAGQAAVMGQPYQTPSPTSALLDLTLGQGPFAAMHLTKSGRVALGGRTSRERAAELSDSIRVAKNATEAAERQTETENKAPDDVYPDTAELGRTEAETTNATINESRAAEQQLKEEGTTLGDEELARVAEKDKELAQAQGKQPGNVFGAQLDANTPRREVSGTLINDETEHRFIKVGDDPANGDLAGKVVGWDKKHDPPSTSEGRFSVPEGYHNEYGLRDDGTLDVDRALNNVDKEVGAAKTGGDLSGAVHGLNGVRESVGEKKVDDVDISERIDSGEVGSPQDAVKAVANETRRVVKVKNEVQGKPTSDDIKMMSELQRRGYTSDDIAAMPLKQLREVHAAGTTPEGVVQPEPTPAAGVGDVMVKLAGGAKTAEQAKVLALAKEHRNRPKFFADRLLNLIETEPGVAAEVGKYGDVEALKAELRPQVVPKLGETFMELDKLPRGDTAAGRPVVQTVKEELIRLVGDTPHKTDLEKLSDYVTMGRTAMLKKWGVTKRDLSEWIREPHVAKWATELRDKIQNPERPSDIVAEDYVSPTTTGRRVVAEVGDTGHSALEWLMTKAPERFARVAKDLAQYSPLLDKVAVKFIRGDGPSHATLYPNTGNVGINMRGWAVDGMSHEEFSRTLMHEMLHALTIRQMHQPWNAGFNEQLTGLRMHVAKQMSPEIASVVDRAVKTNWITRRVQGKTTWDELFPGGADAETKGKVYGLLNNDEFITQALTHKGFMDEMKGIKGLRGGNAWDGFVGWLSGVNKVDLSGSALSDLWTLTGKTAKLNNYVATAQSYTERYFENQGVSPEMAQQMSGRVAEIARMKGKPTFDVDHVINEVMRAPRFGPDVYVAERELQSFLEDSMYAGPEAQKYFAISKATANEIGVKDISSTDLSGYVKDVLKGERTIGDELKVLDPVVTNYVYSVARDVRNVLGAIDSMLDPSVAQYVEGAEKFDRGQMKTLMNRVGSIMRDEAAFVEAERQWKAMAAVSPAGLAAKFAKDVPSVNVAMDVAEAGAEKPPRKLGVIERFLGNGVYLAMNGGRAAKELVTKVNQMEPNKKEMLLSALQPMGLDLSKKPKYGPPRFSSELLKQYEDPMIRKGASKWMFENIRVAGETEGNATKLDKGSPEVQAILRTIPASKHEAVERLVDNGIAMNKVQAANILAKQTDIAALNAATLLARHTGKKAEQNYQIAREIQQLSKADPADPAASMRKQQIRAELGDEAYGKVVNYVVLSDQMLQMQAEFNEANSAWVTTQRYGTWDLHYTVGGKPKFDRVNSEKEGKTVAKERGGVVTSLARNNQSEDIPTTFKVQNLNALRDLEDKQFRLMEEALGADSDEMKQLRASSIVDAIEADFRLAGEKRGLTTNIAKKFERGEEEVDFVQNQLSWLDRGSSFWTRELLRAQARTWLNDPEIVARPDMQGRMKKMVENLMQKDPALGTEARRVAASWFMGLSPASAMANGTQTITRIASEFTARTGNPLKSWKMVMDELVKLPGKAKAGSDEEWVAKQMVKDDTGAVYYEEDPTNKGLEDLQNAMARKGVQSLGQKLSKMHSGMMDKILYFFRMAEKMNQHVATKGAFKMYREKGLSREEAYNEAKLFNQFVNDSGGKAARSVGMFAGRDDFSKNAALLSSTLQGYTLGTTRQMMHWLKTGDGINPSGVSPSEKYYGNRAFVQLIATQFALAGTLGLPFVGGALSAINQVFPELEVNKNLQKWTNLLLAGDEEDGNVLTDMAAVGFPSMFGWDSQSRLSMGNVPGVNEFNGLNPASALGPLPGLAWSTAQGIKKLFGGDPDGLVTMMPPFLKKTVRLITDGGKVRDFNDKPILDPTAGEIAGLALGFNPTRLRKFNDQQRIASQAEKMEDAVNKQKTTELADSLAKGRVDVVNQWLLGEKKKDRAFDMRKKANTIADQAIELTFPRDLRRGGTGSEEYAKALRIMHFKPTAQMPTEVERKQLKMQYLMYMGVRPEESNYRKSMGQATLMDQLRAQNPDASRYELQRAAERIQKGVTPEEALL